MQTIDVRGFLSYDPADPATRAAILASREFAAQGQHIVLAERVAAELDRAREDGARVAILRILSTGGHNGATPIICDAIRRFSAAGGKVVAFVEGAGSGACSVALAADFVVMHPEARFAIHGSIPVGADPGDVRRRAACDAARAVYAARTATPADELGRWVSLREDAAGMNLARLSPPVALSHGWADTIGTLEDAHRIADHLAAGAQIATPRQIMLMHREFGQDPARERELFPSPLPAEVTYALAPAYAGALGAMRRGEAAPGSANLCNVPRLYEMAAANWTARAMPTGSYYAVAWNGSVFCAVGSSNACATSPDGLEWTARTISAGSYWGIAWNGSVFCAVGTNVCATSPDGTTWTPRTIPAGTYNAVAWNGSVFCAAGAASKCATSPDGTTWTAQTFGGSYSVKGIVWGGGVFVAVGLSSACKTSPDGITWTPRTIPAGDYYAVAFDGRFVAVGASGVTAASTDGSAWTAHTVSAALQFAGIASAGTVFCATAGGGAAATSLDAGTTWTRRALSSAIAHRGIAWGGSFFVAVSNDACSVSFAI